MPLDLARPNPVAVSTSSNIVFINPIAKTNNVYPFATTGAEKFFANKKGQVFFDEEGRYKWQTEWEGLSEKEQEEQIKKESL